MTQHNADERRPVDTESELDDTAEHDTATAADEGDAVEVEVDNVEGDVNVTPRADE